MPDEWKQPAATFPAIEGPLCNGPLWTRMICILRLTYGWWREESTYVCKHHLKGQCAVFSKLASWRHAPCVMQVYDKTLLTMFCVPVVSLRHTLYRIGVPKAACSKSTLGVSTIEDRSKGKCLATSAVFENETAASLGEAATTSASGRELLMASWTVPVHIDRMGIHLFEKIVSV